MARWFETLLPFFVPAAILKVAALRRTGVARGTLAVARPATAPAAGETEHRRIPVWKRLHRIDFRASPSCGATASQILRRVSGRKRTPAAAKIYPTGAIPRTE
jgi:hypothetical protein